MGSAVLHLGLGWDLRMDILLLDNVDAAGFHTTSQEARLEVTFTHLRITTFSMSSPFLKCEVVSSVN